MSAANSQRRLTDTWDSAEADESYVGRWSRLVAGEFLGWLDIPAGRRWLDVGCGSGALIQTILSIAQPASVLGVDPSERYVSSARTRIVDQRADVEVGNASALPVADEACDAVVSGLVLNFVPAADRTDAVTEMRRATRYGGVVAAYVWDYVDGMQLMRHFWHAAVALDPAALDLDEGRRFPLCQPEPLAALFHGAGLDDVEVKAIDIPTVFRDFDDLWTPFLGGQGPAPAYAMSLSEDRRRALRDRIRAGLTVAPNGSISLTARAWALRGTKTPS
jgi:SAM-dependent methyltransferase